MAQTSSPASRESHMAGDTAMTEIALALAMAFFSILVLALVSMGAPHLKQDRTASSAEILAAALVPANPSHPDAPSQSVGVEDLLIIHYRGQLFDADLTALDPAALKGLLASTKGRVILAVDPKAPLTEALEARAAIPQDDAVVTVLNADWLARLQAE